MTELLTLRRPTRAHELLNSVPKPKGSVPKNSLPDWTIMDLEQKLPFVRAPDNILIYSRGKIGNKVWKKFKDFVLDDPNCFDVSYSYDPLHDQHLRNFFSNERNMQRVKELGLVNENGHAICSLKSFNEYRRYLKRVHMDLVKKERERREQLDMERRDIEKAKEYAERDADRCARREQKKLKMAVIIAKLQQEEQLKKEDIERRAQRRQRQQYQLERRREMEKEERKAKAEAFDRRIRDHVEAAAKFQRRKVVSTLRQWHKAEIELRRRRIKRIRERKRIKEEKDFRKWIERMEYQKNRMEYIEELLEEEADDFAYRVNLRNERVEKERKRMEDLLQRIKNHRGIKEKYVEKRKQSRQLAKLVLHKWKKKGPRDDVKINRKTVEKAVFETMLAKNVNKPQNDNVIEFLEEVRIRLAKQVYLPSEVKDVIDKILDHSIEQFLWKKVDSFINDIISRGVQTIKNINAKKILNGLNESKSQLIPNNKLYSVDKTKRKSKDFRRITDYDLKRNVRYSFQQSRLSQLLPRKESSNQVSIQSKFTASHAPSTVSFGKVFDIGVTAQDIAKVELKSVRERPPTPVPSLSELADVVFDSPIEENQTVKDSRLTNSSSNINMVERKELIRLLKYLNYNIGKRVYNKLEKEINSQKEIKRPLISITQADIVKAVVNGIIKQGIDYSLNSNELESISQNISGIISQNNFKGHERRRASLLPRKSASKTSKSSNKC